MFDLIILVDIVYWKIIKKIYFQVKYSFEFTVS